MKVFFLSKSEWHFKKKKKMSDFSTIFHDVVSTYKILLSMIHFYPWKPVSDLKNQMMTYKDEVVKH